MMRTRIFIAVILFQLRAVTAQEPVDVSGSFILENKQVRFEFEPVHMGLASMQDLTGGKEHIQPVDGKHLLWEVVFAGGRQIYTITNNYKPCSHASIEKLPDGTARAILEWNRMRWWEEDDAVSVTVIVELPADSGIASWRIFVENNSDYWGLWSVLFPIINGFPGSGKYDIARPSFARGGEWITACDHKQSGRYPGGAWPMQMASLDTGGNSVYLAGMDGEARAKDFVIEPIKDLESQRYPVLFYGRRHRAFEPDPGERVYIEHYPDDMGVQGSDYPDHYPVAFGVHRGGWTEAARIYRSWALEQKWTQKGPLSGRTDVPESLINTGVWIQGDRTLMEGTPVEMHKLLTGAARKLDVPVALHWYEWHSPPFDNLYPHFLPARDGFKERVDELKKNNILVVPYINGSSIDMNIPDFARFEPHTVKDETGGLRQYDYSDHSGRLLSMCPHQVPWQDEIEILVDDIRKQYGVTGIYIDQVSGLSHELCFDRSHLHTLGGGSYWARGNRDLLGKVKKIALRDGGNMVVTSEGATEVYFDLLDGNLLWSPPSEKEIPLVQMVYSGYTVFFGSPCDYTRGDDYFRVVQGQAFIDGRQNGWMDTGLFAPGHEKKVEFLGQCGKYRLNNIDYLVYGRLLDPVLPAGDIGTFTQNGFGWGTVEQQRPVEIPCAEARLWKSEEGNLAVFFANYVDRQIEFPFKIAPGDYGLSQGRWKIREAGLKSSKETGEFSGVLERTEILEPGIIKIVELIPLFNQ